VKWLANSHHQSPKVASPQIGDFYLQLDKETIRWLRDSRDRGHGQMERGVLEFARLVLSPKRVKRKAKEQCLSRRPSRKSAREKMFAARNNSVATSALHKSAPMVNTGASWI
jgi:hypothetical protein